MKMFCCLSRRRYCLLAKVVFVYSIIGESKPPHLAIKGKSWMPIFFFNLFFTSRHIYVSTIIIFIHILQAMDK